MQHRSAVTPPTLLTLGLLAGAAAVLNLVAPTVFFDFQIMLGGSLAVFALLQFGWPGLVVGLAGLAVTVFRWGHPLELIIGTGFLVWLKIFLDRCNGGWRNRDNGRVLVGAATYWLLAGFWLEVGTFTIFFDMPADDAMAIAVKETVTGLVNTTLGLLLFMLVAWRQARGGEEALAIRGLLFTIVLAAVTIPGMGLMYVLSRQLKDAAVRNHLSELRQTGRQVAGLLAFGEGDAAPEVFGTADLAVSVRRPDGTVISTNQSLFDRLATGSKPDHRNRISVPGVQMLRPRRPSPVIAAAAESFWSTTFPIPGPAGGPGPAEVTVVEPVDGLIHRINTELAVPSFLVLLGLILAGGIFSEAMGAAAERQYALLLEPLRRADAERGLPRLPAVKIRELDTLVAAINDRSRRVRELSGSLEAARKELEQTAYELTENIPVGTYTMVLPPDGGMARFEFMSRRFLELTGLEREAARANPLNAFRCVHPDDYDDWVRKNAHCFEHKLPFREECRVVVAGETRWIVAESTPRELPDGSTVWEGVLTDITGRKEAEQQLLESHRRERQAEERMRETLRTKLRTSLTAAAVAHEINQPLSRILLRAQLDRDAAAAEQQESLTSLITDAERVVATIEKMNVLLRNVETAQQPVDLGQVVTSGLIRLKPILRRHSVTVDHAGPPHGCLVLGDDVQLQMIVTNLVKNAAEAIGAGGGSRREISIRRVVAGDRLELVVGDSGPGWPGGDLDEVLLATTKPGGTGVGLYVVKTAVENHQGTITIGRSPLGGAEFRIVFPAHSEQPGATALAAAQPATPSEPSSS